MKITIDFESGAPCQTIDLVLCLSKIYEAITNGLPLQRMVNPAVGAAFEKPTPHPAPGETKPAEPAPAPPPAEPEASTAEQPIGEEQVMELVLQYATEGHSPKEAVSVLQRVAGVAKVNRIPADKMSAVYDEFSRLLAKPVGV